MLAHLHFGKYIHCWKSDRPHALAEYTQNQDSHPHPNIRTHMHTGAYVHPPPHTHTHACIHTHTCTRTHTHTNTHTQTHTCEQRVRERDNTHTPGLEVDENLKFLCSHIEVNHTVCDRSLSQDSFVHVRCLRMETAETPPTKQYLCVGSTELMSCAMSWNWMQYVTRTNEPCQPYEGVSARIRMSHFLYVIVACHTGTYEWCNWSSPHQF